MAIRKATVLLQYRGSRGRPEWWLCADREGDHPIASNGTFDSVGELMRSEDTRALFDRIAESAHRSVNPASGPVMKRRLFHREVIVFLLGALSMAVVTSAVVLSGLLR